MFGTLQRYSDLTVLAVVAVVVVLFRWPLERNLSSLAMCKIKKV